MAREADAVDATSSITSKGRPNTKAPTQFIVLQERSAGNETVGNAWTDAATFPPTATLAEVWAWAQSREALTGRTMIRPDLAPVEGANR